MKTEAEIGVMYAATSQDAPRMTDSHQRLGERHGTNSPSEPPEGPNPADTMILDFWTPDFLTVF